MKPRPSAALSIVIFALSVAAMGYLRLYLMPNSIVALTYGVPLLICLWHKDRVLLWMMTAAFTVMATYKAFFVLPTYAPANTSNVLQYVMQLANIAIVAATVHLVLNLRERLESRNAELQETLHELSARDEEISRQNEELQAQSEELQQQNEELQQQGEELGQQGEELHAQAEELQKKNTELTHRESMLQGMIELLHGSALETHMLERVSKTLLDLCESAHGITFTERRQDDLLARTHGRDGAIAEETWSLEDTFAAIVMGQEKTAYVADLALRPKLKVPKCLEGISRSVLGTPLRAGGKIIGTVEIYATTPHEWTTEEFRVIEWVALQSGLAMDIARLNSELRESREHLERQVEARTAELREMVNELEHFSYTITHDMRAPLRAMRGFAAMLEEAAADGLDESCKGYLRRIGSAAGRMDHLIRDALSYSQAVRAKPDIARLETDQLVREMIDSYPEFQALKEHIHVEGMLPAVLGNEAGLTQCISNLLTNALKFVRPGQPPNVTVRGEQFDGVARIWVEDEGIGIPEEMMPRMFGMFQRASKSYEGTGIGLALVRKVTERMGGRVGVESNDGKGCRFWVELRAAEHGKERDGTSSGIVRRG